jgi:hypothetical protein
MAAFDKITLMDELIAVGWVEALPEERNPDWGPFFQVVIPDNLVEKLRGRVFHVYEARSITNLIDDELLPREE